MGKLRHIWSLISGSVLYVGGGMIFLPTLLKFHRAYGERIGEPAWMKVISHHDGKLKCECGGRNYELRIICYDNSLRICTSPRKTEMIESIPEEIRPEIREDSDKVLITTGERHAEIKKEPLEIRIGRACFRVGVAEGGMIISIPTDRSQHIYGLGEIFRSFDHSSSKVVSWTVDALGNDSQRVYKPIPFFMSSLGYGVFLNSSHKIIYELDRGLIMVKDSELDMFVFLGSLKQIVSAYTSLTGRAPVPPKWSFGLWMSRCMYPSRKVVEEVARKLRELDIPCDVINIDPLWLKSRERMLKDACHFEWNERRFPNPEQMIQRLREMGIKLCLWINPYVPRNSEMYREGSSKGFFPTKNGRPAKCYDNPFASPVDFSNPDACRWYKSKLNELMKMGVATFKTDYGEGAPPDAKYALYRGEEMHNLYPLLYNKCVFDAVKEYYGRGIVWARSAYAGSQRFPVHWSGDPRCTFGSMRSVLRAGLNAGLSGIPFWSNDIGGFAGIPTRKLYIRWAQFGLLCSHSRCHGTSPREPWEFGEEALEIFRKYAKLRYRLIPYLYTYAHISSQTGHPMMRAMVLEFEDDEETHELDTQYLLGRELLIAPVLNRKGESRVYLPAGRWIYFWDDSEHDGPRWIERVVPLSEIPIFVRGDSIIPMGEEMQWVRESSKLTLEVYVYSHASFTLMDDERSIRFEASRTEHEASFKSSMDGEYTVRFHNVPLPSAVTADGESAEFSYDGTLSVKARREVLVRF